MRQATFLLFILCFIHCLSFGQNNSDLVKGEWISTKVVRNFDSKIWNRFQSDYIVEFSDSNYVAFNIAKDSALTGSCNIKTNEMVLDDTIVVSIIHVSKDSLILDFDGYQMFHVPFPKVVESEHVKISDSSLLNTTWLIEQHGIEEQIEFSLTSCDMYSDNRANLCYGLIKNDDIEFENVENWRLFTYKEQQFLWRTEYNVFSRLYRVLGQTEDEIHLEKYFGNEVLNKSLNRMEFAPDYKNFRDILIGNNWFAVKANIVLKDSLRLDKMRSRIDGLLEKELRKKIIFQFAESKLEVFKSDSLFELSSWRLSNDCKFLYLESNTGTLHYFEIISFSNDKLVIEEEYFLNKLFRTDIPEFKIKLELSSK